MDTTAPANCIRWRTKSTPVFKGINFRFRYEKPYAFRLARKLGAFYGFECVGKLHSGVAKYDDEFIVRNHPLHDIQIDDAIFSTTKRNVEDIDLVPILAIFAIYLLNRILREHLHQFAVFFDHFWDIDGDERIAAIRIVDDDEFGGRIERSAFRLCNRSPSIDVIIRLGPHDGSIVVLGVAPIFVESQDVELAIINRARFFAKFEFVVGEQ